MALAPVVGVADELYRLVALELDEFKGARSDRLGAHLRRRYVARIDRVVAGRKQRGEGGLWAPEVKGHLVIASGGDLLEVMPPDLARVLAECVGPLVLQLVKRADHVLGGEGRTVVPLHILAQLEGQLGLIVVPCPTCGKLRANVVGGI